MEYAKKINQPVSDINDSGIIQKLDQPELKSSDVKHTVIEVTSFEHRQELVNNNEIVVIKYGAEWCGPCKKSKPDYISMCEEDTSNRCIYLTEDIDEEYENHAEPIASIPAFHIYKNKEFVQSLTGANMKPVFALIEHLKKNN